MYQVYSQQRPGRPSLAIVSTALLLLLTVGLAWALIQYKGRVQSVSLGEPQIFAEGGIRCRLPLGWEEKRANELPSRVVAALVEQNASDGNARQLWLFRGKPHQLALPSTDAVSAVNQIIQAILPGGKLQDYGFGRIGTLPGWTVGSALMLPIRGKQAVYCLGRAAVAPQGQVLGAILISAGPIRMGDRQLLDQISENIELLSVQPADGEKVMASAGIQFRKPSQAVFFSESSPLTRRVQMLGGEENETWYLDAYCVPLMASRKPADLVTDFCLSALQQTDLSEPVTSSQIQNRNFAETTITTSHDAEPSAIIACVQTEEHTGLLLVGRYEPGAKKTLREIIHTIARNAVVKPFNERTNIAAAEDTARRWLKEIATNGIGLDPKRPYRQDYLIQSAAMDWGRELRHAVSTTRDGALWWEIAVQLKLEYDAQEEWELSNDGKAHTYDYHFNSRSLKAQYSESRESGAQQVHRELVVLHGGVRRVNTSVESTYAPEPVLLRVMADMAWAAKPEPAIFNMTDTFAKESVYWTVLPAGHVEQTSKKDNASLAAVQLQRDFDPSPIMLYFNEKRILIAIAGDSGRWQILESESPPIDLVR